MTTTDPYALISFRSARGCLSYLVFCTRTREAVVIDPSVEVGHEYVRSLASGKLKLKYIIDTHTHADHISASRELKKRTGALYLMHEKAPSSAVDRRLRDGDAVACGDVILRVLYTPGHAKDMITLVFDDVAFTADTLLIGGTGRTDLHKDARSAELYDSIWQKIIPLGDSTRLYPGHDYGGRECTTIGDEKRASPRLQLSREEFIRQLDAHHPPLPELFEESMRANSA